MTSTSKSNRDQPRRITTALAGAAIGIGSITGGLLLLGPSASAQVADEQAPVEAVAADDTTLDGEWNGDVEFDIEQMQEEWAAFDGCLVDQGVLTAEELEEMYAYPEDWEDGDFEDFDEFDDEFDGDHSDFDGDYGDMAFATVESDGELTFIEFGEEDGSVTITKNGNDITVSSTGDVFQETIDLDAEIDAEFLDDGDYEDFDGDFDGEWTPEMEAELEAEMAEWDAAFEACEDLAPEGALDYEDLDDEGHEDQ